MREEITVFYSRVNEKGKNSQAPVYIAICTVIAIQIVIYLIIY